MSKSTRGIRAAGVASLAVSLSIGVAAPALAAPGFEFTRIAGADRYETAVKASEQYGAADDVIIANGQPGEYADALAGNYLAGAEDAPILLTKRSGLPEVTKDRLATIDPTNVWIVGGEAAVPADQEAELAAAGYNVERIAGDDRFGTNAEVIAADGASTGGVGLIATGLNFPDALAAGPFAYKGHSLGLVRTNSVPDAVGDALEADGVKSVLIFGGTDVVGAGVVSDLAARGITVTERFAGADRSETSELAAEWAVKNLKFSDEHVGVASGYTEGFGADALAGGPVEGNENSPMLITRNVDNPDDVLDYLKAHSATLADGHIYGGTAAISAAAEAAMEAAAQGTGNQEFTATPANNQTVERGTVTQFSFSGITSSTVDIALVGCENVTTTNGVTTFPNSSNPGGSGNVANLGGAGTDTDITVINGSAVSEEQYADNVTVNNGSVTFTVSNNSDDCYVAVVWSDADDDDNLDLGTNNQPSEDFGNSGDVNVIPPEATEGAFGVDVTSLDKAANLFTGSDLAAENPPTNAGTFYYDANDEFLLEAGAIDTPLTLEQFEARLSVGDDVRGNYRANPANQSTFTLSDTSPAPVTIDAKTPDGTNAGKAGIEVEWTDSATATVASYQVFRATATQPTITGQPVSCPSTTTAGAYSQIGTVQDTKSSGIYEYLDTTAQQPTAGSNPANPQYCYYVVAVDSAGDPSAPSNVDGPQAASAGDTSGAPEFVSASAAAASSVVTVNYDEDIKPTSTDADASNYQVTVTRGDVTTALTEVSTNDADANTVEITVSGFTFQAGDVVVVRAVVGGDGNTVLDLTDVAQPTNDAVQTTVPTPAP